MKKKAVSVQGMCMSLIKMKKRRTLASPLIHIKPIHVVCGSESHDYATVNQTLTGGKCKGIVRSLCI